MGPCSAYRRQTGWHEGIDARRRRPAMRRVRMADRIRAGQGARRVGRPRQHDHSPLAPGLARCGRGCEPSCRADRGPRLSAGSVRNLGPRRHSGSHRADADALRGCRRICGRQRDADLDRYMGRAGGLARSYRTGDTGAAALGLGADRDAGDRLCRAAVLCLGAGGPAATPHQHGRADQPWGSAGHRASAFQKPSTAATTPISTQPSPCCSSCSSAGCWIIEHAVRRGPRRNSCSHCERPMSPWSSRTAPFGAALRNRSPRAIMFWWRAVRELVSTVCWSAGAPYWTPAWSPARACPSASNLVPRSMPAR